MATSFETFAPPPPYMHHTSHTRLSPPDFETASIRSAAPSYHSTLPSLPAPTPRPNSTASANIPSLTHFTNPRSSFTPLNPSTNPTARHYHSVASRRAHSASLRTQAQISACAAAPNPMQALQETFEEEQRLKYADRVRPEEDEELVGREAAERARRERMGWGRGVLEREERRWDWMLAQMKDWDEREKSWNKFRTELEQGRRGKLARRLGLKK